MPLLKAEVNLSTESARLSQREPTDAWQHTNSIFVGFSLCSISFQATSQVVRFGRWCYNQALKAAMSGRGAERAQPRLLQVEKIYQATVVGWGFLYAFVTALVTACVCHKLFR